MVYSELIASDSFPIGIYVRNMAFKYNNFQDNSFPTFIPLTDLALIWFPDM